MVPGEISRAFQTACYGLFGEAAGQMTKFSESDDEEVTHTQRTSVQLANLDLLVDVEVSFRSDPSFVAQAVAMAAVQVQIALQQAIRPLNKQRLRARMGGLEAMMAGMANEGGENSSLPSRDDPQTGNYM